MKSLEQEQGDTYQSYFRQSTQAHISLTLPPNSFISDAKISHQSLCFVSWLHFHPDMASTCRIQLGGYRYLSLPHVNVSAGSDEDGASNAEYSAALFIQCLKEGIINYLKECANKQFSHTIVSYIYMLFATTHQNKQPFRVWSFLRQNI